MERQVHTLITGEGKFELIAFDDNEIGEWLIKLAENRSGQFLYALSEAVMKANDEDYSIIRPALMNLKRKYSEAKRRLESLSSPIASRVNGGS